LAGRVASAVENILSTALATLPANVILHGIPSSLRAYLAAVESPSLLTAVSWLPWFWFASAS